LILLAAATPREDKEVVMPASTPAATLLSHEFLALRCHLIDLAAMLDRIDRAGGVAADDPRWLSIRRGLDVLAAPGPNRAAQVQMVFSLPYEQEAAGG
jgi:hypothetical protein